MSNHGVGLLVLRNKVSAGNKQAGFDEIKLLDTLIYFMCALFDWFIEILARGN